MRYLVVGVLLMGLACAGNELAEEMQNDRPEYVHLCFENGTDRHVTARTYSRSGSYLGRTDVRSFGEATDSVARSRTDGMVHFALEAVGDRRTYRPPGLQGVLTRPELGVNIGAEGRELFAHSSIDPNGCA